MKRGKPAVVLGYQTVNGMLYVPVMVLMCSINYFFSVGNHVYFWSSFKLLADSNKLYHAFVAALERQE